ncbi:hypothetical protein MRS44_016243 [Fusarium solani]|uniref:uncharacterized protein n=1 Tax=Fusarium solani TaxID=169388 RepID=UPI0032C3EB72|nr:hypothetical protein MRS44_016243 [Fusarium solani]
MVTDRTRPLVQHIWLHVAIPRYTCLICHRRESQSSWIRNNRMIKVAVLKLFAILMTRSTGSRTTASEMGAKGTLIRNHRPDLSATASQSGRRHKARDTSTSPPTAHGFQFADVAGQASPTRVPTLRTMAAESTAHTPLCVVLDRSIPLLPTGTTTLDVAQSGIPLIDVGASTTKERLHHAMELLYLAALVASRMPKLQEMILWNGGKGHACAFRYSRQKAAITVQSTWGVGLHHTVEAIWQQVLMLHTGCRLHVDVRTISGTAILCHGDAIHELGLPSGVIDAGSLSQMRQEARMV